MTLMTQGLRRPLTLSDVSTRKQTIELENKIMDGNKPAIADNKEHSENQEVKEKIDAAEKEIDAASEKEVVETASEKNRKQISKRSEDGSLDTDESSDSEEKDISELDDDPEEHSESEKIRRKSRNQKRIERLSKQASELRDQLSQALQYIQKMNSDTNAESKNNVDPKPRREDFDDPDSYDDALVKWSSNKTKKELEDSEKQKTQEAQAKKVREAWAAKVELGNDKYDDFDDVVLNDKLPFSLSMSQAVLSLDNGEDVAYYLGKNLDIAKNICNMDAVQAGIEISKISLKLEKPQKEDEEKSTAKAEEEKVKKKISKAPEPIKPASSKRSSDIVDLDNETPKEYRERRLRETKYTSLKPIRKIR